MAKYLTLPNGDYVEVSEGLTYDEALARAQQKFPDAFKPKEPPRTGLGAALSKGIESLVSSGRTGIESLTGSPEEAAARGLERGKAMGDKYAEQVSFEKVKQAYDKNGALSAAGEAISQVPAALAEQAPNMAATLASAQAGQRIGSFFGTPGRLVGAGVGAALPGLAQMFGSNIERQAKEQQDAGKPVEINRGAAAAAAVPQAALDVASQFIPLGGRLVSKLTGVPEKALVSKSAAQVQKLADEKLYATLAKGLGTGALAEIPTEVAQQMLERAQAGLSLTSPDALKEYGETAYQVGLLAPLGAAGRVAQRSGARAEIQQKQEADLAAERDRLADEEDKRLAALKARENTSEYAREVRDQLQSVLAQRAELDKVANGKTEAGDLLGEQAKRDARAKRKELLGNDETKRLISEFNRLKGLGLYDQIAAEEAAKKEQERVDQMSPMDYLLENTGTVSTAKTKAVEPDMGGLYEQQIVTPNEARLKYAAAEKARAEGLPAAYAAERMELARTQTYDPTGQDYVEYLLQDPYKASLIVESRIQLPGLTANESSMIRNTLARRLKAMSKEELTARQAELQGQRVGAEPANPMAAFMEQSEGLDVDRRQGLTDADIAFAEKQAAMPTDTTTQGELFGGERQRVNMPVAVTPADIDSQIADLRRQLDVARSYGAPDTVNRQANRARVNELVEKIKDLESRKTVMESGAPMGNMSDAVRAYIAAGTPARAPGQSVEDWYASLPETPAGGVSNMPAQEKAAQARRDAVSAFTADDYNMRNGLGATEATVEKRKNEVVDALLTEISNVRGKLKPETITAIEREVRALLDNKMMFGQDYDAVLDGISNRWRAGTRIGTFGATEATPTQTSPEMLREQLDRAFAMRDRYDALTMGILTRIADNLNAFAANPERRNIAGEWLHRVTTTGRASPEATNDLRGALRQLSAARQANAPEQRELDADLFPEAVAPQAETRVVNGKVQYVSPEDKGPLQGSAAERYAPMQKGTIFDTPEELDRYLASDYLKEARENQGLARETVARLSKQVSEYDTQMADLQKQLDALQERKAELAKLQVSERRTANNIIADAESQLETLLGQMADDLGPIRMALEQAEMNLAAAEARSEETSRLIANNLANYTYMDDKVVRAAQATVEAKAELRKARNKLGSLEEKRPLIEEAQRKVIAALQRQRNPVLYEMQEKMQDLQAKLEKAKDTQPRTAERLEKEIAELEDQMDVQRDNPYVPSSALITFLNNDLQLQMDAIQDRAKIGAAKRSVTHFTKKLSAAAADLDVNISTHPEVKALREQIGMAKELGTDALRGVEGEMALLDDEIEKLQNAQSAVQRQANNIEDQIIEASESRSFAAQLAGTTPETVSALDRAETLAKDKAKLDAFQESTKRLEALPGQRIDFSKRQEMFQLVKASDEDFAALDAAIADMEEGIDELQARNHFIHEEMLDLEEKSKSFRGPRKNSKEGKAHFAKIEELKQKTADNNDRVESLRRSIAQYEKTRATKQAALAKAEVAMSSDPEIYNAITASIDKRMAKIERTIAGKKEAVVKADSAILEMARDIKAKAEAGKTSPEKLEKMRERLKVLKASQADRNKHLKELFKEYEVLKTRRSNRLGIKRTLANIDALKEERDTAEARLRVLNGIVNSKTAKKAEKDAAKAEIETLTEALEDLRKRLETRPKKATLTEQETMDAELDRVQELARANERLTQLQNGLAALQKAKEPKTEAKKTERAERIAAAQAEINKLEAEIAALQPTAVGAVSQASKVQSSAPGKFRTGTAESKAQVGISRSPIIESRKVAQPTAEQAVADANAFAAKIAAGRTPAERAKLLETKDEQTRAQLEDALNNNVEYLKNRIASLEAELKQMGTPTGVAAVDRAKQIRRELTGEIQDVGDVETDGLRKMLAVAEADLQYFNAAVTEAEEVGFTEGSEEAPDLDAAYRTSTQGGTGMPVDAVERLSERVTERWANAPEIVVVASERQLPVRIMNQVERDNKWGLVPGLYDVKTKKVYLIASNLHSPEDVFATVAHEATGHFGLQSLLGANYASTMQDIYNGNAAVRAAADKNMKDSPNLSLETAVEEVLAEKAEEDPNAPDTRSALRKVYDAIKSFFKNVFGMKDTVSDEAVRQIVANARKFVVEGGEAGVGIAQASGLNYRTGEPVFANTTLAKAGAVFDKAIAKQRGVMDAIKEEGAGLKLMTNMVDRFAPMEKLAKYMPSLKGLQMMYYLRMYDQRMNFVAQSVGTGALRRVEKTRADGQKEFVIESAPGASLKGVVTTLKDGNALVGSAEGNSRLFSMYLVAKRAERVGLAKLNYGGKVTEQDLQDVRHAVNTTPGLKDIYDRAQREYNQYNRDMLQFAVDTGALSAKARDELVKHGDYVPYYRQRNGGVEMMLGGQSIAQIGSVKDQPYLQELVGGEEPILDFMTSAVQNTNMLADMSLRNLATKNAVFELQELGMATIGKGNAASGPNVVKFKVDGVDKYAMLDTEDLVVNGKKYPTGIPADLVVKGMEGIPVQNTIITKLMGGPARALRKFVVLNPLYAARQLFRDSLAAPMLSGANFTPIVGALRTIGTDTGKTLERRGITGGQVFTGTSEDLTTVLRQISSGESSFAQGVAKLESMSMEADALTRRAQYNSYIKQGLSEMEATYMALESMNFGKRGANPAMHTLSTVIPFFNAQIQSLNVLFKAFSGNMPFNEKLKIREKLYQRGMMMAAMTMTYAALMQDDEGYKNATPEQKYGNWFVKFPGMEEALRIPIPFEMGYIFKAIPEAIVNSMMSQHGGEEAAKAFKQIALQTIPGGSSYGVPQAMRPLLEAGLGKSFYTGRDLESAHEKTLEPGQRARGTTTELARLVGEKLNISPIKIDHLIQGYLSTTGLALADALSFALPSPERPVEATKRLSEMRVVGSLFQPKDANGIINATYDRMKRAAEVKDTYRDMLKNGRTAEAQRYLQENLQDYALSSAEQNFSKYMQEIAKKEQAIRASTRMTADEKRTALDQYKQLKIQFATSVRAAADRTAPQ